MYGSVITSWQAQIGPLGDGCPAYAVTLMLGLGIACSIDDPSNRLVESLTARHIECERIITALFANLRAGVAGKPAVGDMLTVRSGDGMGGMDHLGLRVTHIMGAATPALGGAGNRVRLACVPSPEAIIAYDQVVALQGAGGGS